MLRVQLHCLTPSFLPGYEIVQSYYCYGEWTTRENSREHSNSPQVDKHIITRRKKNGSHSIASEVLYQEFQDVDLYLHTRWMWETLLLPTQGVPIHFLKVEVVNWHERVYFASCRPTDFPLKIGPFRVLSEIGLGGKQDVHHAHIFRPHPLLLSLCLAQLA